MKDYLPDPMEFLLGAIIIGILLVLIFTEPMPIQISIKSSARIESK